MLVPTNPAPPGPREVRVVSPGPWRSSEELRLRVVVLSAPVQEPPRWLRRLDPQLRPPDTHHQDLSCTVLALPRMVWNVSLGLSW